MLLPVFVFVCVFVCVCVCVLVCLSVYELYVHVFVCLCISVFTCLLSIHVCVLCVCVCLHLISRLLLISLPCQMTFANSSNISNYQYSSNHAYLNRFYTLLVISTALFNKPPYKNLVVNGLVLAK